MSWLVPDTTDFKAWIRVALESFFLFQIETFISMKFLIDLCKVGDISSAVAFIGKVLNTSAVLEYKYYIKQHTD